MKEKIKKIIPPPLFVIFVISVSITWWYFNHLTIIFGMPVMSIRTSAISNEYLEARSEGVYGGTLDEYLNGLNVFLGQKIAEREKLNFFARAPMSLVRYNINSKIDNYMDLKIVSNADKIVRESIGEEYKLIQSKPTRKPFFLECNFNDSSFRINHGENWNLGMNFRLEDVPGLIKRYSCKLDTESVLIPPYSTAYFNIHGSLLIKITPSVNSYLKIFFAIFIILLVLLPPQIREFIRIIKKGWHYFTE